MAGTALAIGVGEELASGEAIVAWSPVEQPDVERYLERLAATAESMVVGVRRSFEMEVSEFPAATAVIAGVKAVAPFGYSFDLVIRLVESCPEVQFILDHIGKPRIREGIEQPWRQHIAQLARFPNVQRKFPDSSPKRIATIGPTSS